MIKVYQDPFKEMLDTFFECPINRVRRDNEVRVTNNESDYKIVIPVPGLTKDDLNLKIKEGVLQISYEHNEESETYSFVHSFSKQYNVPDDVDEKNIAGKVENGVLEVTLPKSKKKSLERLISLN